VVSGGVRKAKHGFEGKAMVDKILVNQWRRRAHERGRGGPIVKPCGESKDGRGEVACVVRFGPRWVRMKVRMNVMIMWSRNLLNANAVIRSSTVRAPIRAAQDGLGAMISAPIMWQIVDLGDTRRDRFARSGS
jgi:hypothetical protein